MRYLALGDSFTIGTGTTPDRSFPAVLLTRWWDAGRECDLRNPAVNGFTTDDLIRDELPLVEALQANANSPCSAGSGARRDLSLV